jgi:hypothetical protein
MIGSASTANPLTGETLRPVAREELAEHHLMHRILVATAIAIPVGAAVLAALVGGATAIAGQPAALSALMGAGIGVLAGAFFGVWAGFVASIRELDEADLPQRERVVAEVPARTE